MEKAYHYYSITVTILKNGQPFSKEVHGAYSHENNSAHSVDKIKSIVTGELKPKYPNDTIEVVVMPGDVTEITKEMYEGIHNESI
jgi:hypothetical protein